MNQNVLLRKLRKIALNFFLCTDDKGKDDFYDESHCLPKYVIRSKDLTVPLFGLTCYY